MKTRHQQRGVALIALLAIIVLGASYWIYTALNANTASAAVERSKRDIDVLQQAKAALIGQIALQAANTAEPNPGRFPCPEKAADAGTANEGLAENSVATGHPFGYCGTGAAVVIGRLPWKALGIDKLQDAATEPLWYAVAPAWIPKDSASTLLINSDNPASGGLASTATLSEDAVAVIFAPGQPLAGQARQPIDGVTAPNVMNYLDSPNNTLGVLTLFAKTGAADTFNDHVITITRAELMPLIEAAVADRFARQIAPVIKNAYSTAPWTAAPVLPFAVTFANPSTSDYKGSTATQGLLPVTYSTTSGSVCDVADLRCDPSFVAWRDTPAFTRTGGANVDSYACTASGTPSILDCTVHAWTPVASGVVGMTFDMTITANNVGKALRRLDPSVTFSGAGSYTIGSASLNTDGSAGVVFSSSFSAATASPQATLGGVSCATLGYLCYDYRIQIPIALLADHQVIDKNDASNGWFVRNQWHQLAYYALAAGVAPSQSLPRSCATGASCLTASYLSDTSFAGDSVRGLVVIAGRQLSGQDRTTGTRSSYFEDVNATATTTYVARSPTLAFNRSFNDRVVVIDHN